MRVSKCVYHSLELVREQTDNGKRREVWVNTFSPPHTVKASGISSVLSGTEPSQSGPALRHAVGMCGVAFLTPSACDLPVPVAQTQTCAPSYCPPRLRVSPPVPFQAPKYDVCT